MNKEEVMNKEELKKWLPEINFWVNGGTLWIYDPIDDTWNKKLAQTFRTDQIYVINDQHLEARKAFALGNPIENKCLSESNASFEGVINPSWTPDKVYRPKPKEVYEWQWVLITEGTNSYKPYIKYSLSEFYSNKKDFESLIDRQNNFYGTATRIRVVSRFEPSKRLVKKK